jgi:nucleoside-diphosphate kinase
MIKEKTLVVIKPDGIQRTLVGEIIGRLERVGLKLVGVKMVIPDSNLIKKHYSIDREWVVKAGKKSIDSFIDKGEEPKTRDPKVAGEKILDVLEKYMTSGPVFVMVWQGANSVGVVRKIVGQTEPMSSDVGTIRGDFVLDSYKFADVDGRAVRNLIHASGSVEEAEKEIYLWFDENEIINYRLVQEQIIYDVNLDGIIE